MSAVAAVDELLADYLRQHLADGDEGKTLLVGLDGVSPVFVVAAGLRGAVDHPRFLVFARHLLHRRFHCDGHALMLPALLDGVELYAVERDCQGDMLVQTVDAGGRRQSSDLGGRLIGDLAVAESGLPGVMRREFDSLYEQLRLPLPGTTQG